MNLVSALKSIKEAQDNNQLVIFVGAGVSKNSGLPSWYELIKNIADKIDYNEKCKNCDDKGDNCPKKDCKKRYEFSQEEFLKIPEYFFNCDNSINHKEYYDFISESLKYEKKVNLIDDEVFKILPRHIITTNYDTLLEDSNTVNRKLYTVVAKDADLLSNSKEKRVEPFANKIGLNYISLALKPLPFGFFKAKKALGLKHKEVAIVGDQIFTDVLGGNLVGVKTLLLTPIKLETTKGFVFKRKLEKIVYKLHKINDMEN